MNALTLLVSLALTEPAAHAGMAISVPEPPAKGEGTPVHMARHKWATEQMWLGLIGPSDEAWTKGSELLGDDPLGADHGEGLVDAAVDFHALGPVALTATDGAARAQVYGKVIASCAGCHPVPEPQAE